MPGWMRTTSKWWVFIECPFSPYAAHLHLCPLLDSNPNRVLFPLVRGGVLLGCLTSKGGVGNLPTISGWSLAFLCEAFSYTRVGGRVRNDHHSNIKPRSLFRSFAHTVWVTLDPRKPNSDLSFISLAVSVCVCRVCDNEFPFTLPSPSQYFQPLTHTGL